jgi:hypothetical protein
VIVYDENFSNNININTYHKNIKKFYHESDIIFICYKNNKFKKIEKFSSSKTKIIIDLWNYIKINKKNIIVKKLGIN